MGKYIPSLTEKNQIKIVCVCLSLLCCPTDCPVFKVKAKITDLVPSDIILNYQNQSILPQNDSDNGNLVLASEWTPSHNHFVVKSIDFDRFMTSEGTERLF